MMSNVVVLTNFRTASTTFTLIKSEEYNLPYKGELFSHEKPHQIGSIPGVGELVIVVGAGVGGGVGGFGVLGAGVGELVGVGGPGVTGAGVGDGVLGAGVGELVGGGVGGGVGALVAVLQFPWFEKN